MSERYPQSVEHNTEYTPRSSKEWLPEPEPQLKLDVEQALLSCPFCGEMAKILRDQYRVIVSCPNKHEISYLFCDFASIEIAIATAISVWNTRYYPQGVVAALICYYRDDQRSVEEGILESVDKRPAARALRAIGVLPTKEVDNNG